VLTARKTHHPKLIQMGYM